MTSLDLRSQVKNRIDDLTDPSLASSELSLTNCDREPIHISNAIQAHGVMLAFSATDSIISQVSQNSQVFLGKKPAQLLGKPLSILMEPEQLTAIRDCLNGEFENVNPLIFLLSVRGKPQTFTGIVHQTDGVVILELEPVIAQSVVSFFDFLNLSNHRSIAFNLLEISPNSPSKPSPKFAVRLDSIA
jgi:two-component system, chemotaxis family, sensor kinase Cph1